MDSKIKTLIVEDDPVQRNSTKTFLELHGIAVDVAGTADEASRELERLWKELEVVILDIELGPDGVPTGPEVAIAVRDRKRNSPGPEFILLTRYDTTEYYRCSLNLGAAAYLRKGKGSPLAHVKVLALRRALNVENRKTNSEVEQIAVQSRNISEAIQTFCLNVLKPQFERCLGKDTRFVILFTEGYETRNCADNAGLRPDEGRVYHTLQALAHGMGNPVEPFVFDISKLNPPPDEETLPLYQRFEHAAFLPISLSNEMKLSIGILRPEGAQPREKPYRDERTEEEELCAALAQHLRPTVLENIITLWSLWTESSVNRNSIAKLCLRVGQDINDSLEMGDREQIQELADDLVDTGQFLNHSHSRSDRGEEVSARDVLQASWELIARAEGRPGMTFDVQGDCVVRAQRRDIAIIISRLLQWFAYRGKATPLDVPPALNVRCETDGAIATITFEDHSHRLPLELRRRLFESFSQALSTPFPQIESSSFEAEDAAGARRQKKRLEGRYLPLYLAKILIEGRYHGVLEDQTDKIEGRNYGHRILIQLPAGGRSER